VKGKWSAGIEPRSFTWVFKGALAISERPGGNTSVHRKVRRDEELLWLKQQGFTRVLSILPPMAALEGYAEKGLAIAHYPLRGGPQQGLVLDACYEDVAKCLENKTTVLLHGDEVSDRLLGVLAGYLLWSKRAPSAPTSIALIERLVKRTIGPDGRALMADVPLRRDPAES
jgi:hypothetical protein